MCLGIGLNIGLGQITGVNGSRSYWSSYAYVRSLIMNKPFSYSGIISEFFSDNWNKEI